MDRTDQDDWCDYTFCYIVIGCSHYVEGYLTVIASEDWAFVLEVLVNWCSEVKQTIRKLSKLSSDNSSMSPTQPSGVRQTHNSYL